MHRVRWGDQEMHPKYATEHFLCCGASGSGKTTLINMLLKSVIESPRRLRALVYDAKQEILPLLYSLLAETEEQIQTGTSRIKVLNPLDDRCCAWDLSKDIDGPISARQFATLLVSEDGNGSGSEAFFINAVRDILTALMLVFIRCVPNPGVWTFRDLILGILYEPYTHFLMQLDRTRDGEPFPIVSRIRNSYLDRESCDARTVGNIRASINAKLSIFEPIAATWAIAAAQSRTFSVTSWLNDDSQDALVLGNDESARAGIDRINQALFKRIIELLLARREATSVERETGENQTWFFLDEIKEAKLEGIDRLLTKSRSKGACCVLGFQDMDGMRSAYEEQLANEICAQCNSTAILRLNSPTTAQWASDLFGRRLAQSHSGGHSYDHEGKRQRSHDSGEDERPYLFTSDFLYLPPTGRINGLNGYFRSADIDPERHELRVHMPWSEVDNLLPRSPVLPENSWRAAQRLLPVSSHYLMPWDEADWHRLGLDKIVGAPIAHNAPPHHQPRVDSAARVLRPLDKQQGQ